MGFLKTKSHDKSSIRAIVYRFSKNSELNKYLHYSCSRLIDFITWVCITYSNYATFPQIDRKVNTQVTEQGNRMNNTQEMDELRDMMQTLVGVVHAQQQLLQQHF